MLRRPVLPLAALAITVLLSGCYVEAGHVHYDDCGCDNGYAVGFSATAVSIGSYGKSELSCPYGTEVVLDLTLRNDGPFDDVYSDHAGSTHRFLVYDEWDHLVWDSWLHTPAVFGDWSLPDGATITFSETWDLRDDFGYELPPGLYQVEAHFTGDLAGGPVPGSPAPVLIEILPTVSG